MKKRVVKTLLCMCATVGLVSSSYAMPVMADSDVTLTLAMCGDGTTKASLDKLLEKYTEETGVKVESMFIAGNWGEYCTKLQTMVGGGDEVDCAILAIEGVSKFLNMGIAEPIDDWIEANPDIAKEILDDTSPSFQEVFKKASVFFQKRYLFSNDCYHSIRCDCLGILIFHRYRSH